MPPVDGYEPRTYGDAFADVYDEWYGDVDDATAVADVLAGLARGGAVLELGVGSGRLAAPLAAGTTVWGLDASPAMLARLADRPGGERVTGVLGDMADPVGALARAGGGVAPPPFAVVVAAFNTFFLLSSAQDQARCLAGVAQLLAPDGVLVLECFVPGDRPDGIERVVEARTVAVDHVVLTASIHDPETQVVRGQHIELRETGTKLRPWVVRYATPAQLDDLAGAAGLRRRERWSGWDRQPFTDGSTRHVSVYEHVRCDAPG